MEERISKAYGQPKFEIETVSYWYEFTRQALKAVTFQIPQNAITVEPK